MSVKRSLANRRTHVEDCNRYNSLIRLSSDIRIMFLHCYRVTISPRGLAHDIISPDYIAGVILYHRGRQYEYTFGRAGNKWNCLQDIATWSERVTDWMSEWASERVSEWVSEWASERVSEWMNEWVSEWVSEYFELTVLLCKSAFVPRTIDACCLKVAALLTWVWQYYA